MLGLALLGRSAAAQCPDGTPPPCRGAARAAGAPPPHPTSLAVLYFDNLSRDSGDIYLADGVTEELISRLSQVERLQVKSRTAVQRLRGRPLNDPVAVGRSLAVAHLVSGSVLRARDRLRVTVELTRVATGNSVWSRSFDRPADDLIGTEAEIAESVAVNVGARLAPAERRRIESRPTRNPAAYDHLLRGRFAMARRTNASLLAAVREFEAALRLDSLFTSAWVALGQAYLQLANVYYSPEIGMSREEVSARGRAAVDRALRQDSTSVEALVARAIWQPAVQNRPLLTRAVALEPRNADAHHLLGLSLRMLGEDSAAAAAFRRAVDIEPDRVISLQNLGQTLLMSRRVAAALPWLDSAVALRPDAAFFYSSRAYAQLLVGDTAGARRTAPLIASHGSPNAREQVLAMLEARAGDSSAARARMAAVDAAMRDRDCFLSHDCIELSFALGVVGLRDRALAVLERIRPRGSWLAYWTGRPEFDAIRADPRFRSVVAEARANGDVER
jgi:TolB-like protein